MNSSGSAVQAQLRNTLNSEDSGLNKEKSILFDCYPESLSHPVFPKLLILGVAHHLQEEVR